MVTASFSLIGHMAAHVVAIFVEGGNIGTIDNEIMNMDGKKIANSRRRRIDKQIQS